MGEITDNIAKPAAQSNSNGFEALELFKEGRNLNAKMGNANLHAVEIGSSAAESGAAAGAAGAAVGRTVGDNAGAEGAAAVGPTVGESGSTAARGGIARRLGDSSAGAGSSKNADPSSTSEQQESAKSRASSSTKEGISEEHMHSSKQGGINKAGAGVAGCPETGKSISGSSEKKVGISDGKMHEGMEKKRAPEMYMREPVAPHDGGEGTKGVEPQGKADPSTELPTIKPQNKPESNPIPDGVPMTKPFSGQPVR